MYRTIIVPLDGSARSSRALSVAARLARASNAQLELARVHLEDRPDLAGDPSWDAMFREGEQRYLEALALAYESVAGRPVLTSLLDAPVVGAIATLAESRAAPLIVMAARGRTGIRRALLGSTSDGLVRGGSAPVLLLRDPPHDDDTPLWLMRRDPFTRIIVPLDGKPFAEAGIAHALAIAAACNASVHLLRVVGPVTSSAVFGALAMYPAQSFDADAVTRSEAALEYLEGIVHRIRIGPRAPAVTTEVSIATDPSSAIIDSAKRRGADLVVMATHGRGISRLLVGAVGDRLLRDGPDAILFIRPEKGSVPAGLRSPSREAEPVVAAAGPLVPWRIRE